MQIPNINQIDSINEDWEDEVISLKKKAVNGVFVLGFRRIGLQIIQSVANIILARILFPEDFGTFTIIYLITTFFSLVSDIGLSAAFVQKPKKPTTKELQSIFTLQVFMGFLAVFLVWIIAPFYLDFFHYSIKNGVYLIRLSSFALIFLNLRVISGCLLERELAFSKQTIIEVAEMFILQFVTIILAIQGFGVASFIWGVLVSRFLISVIYFFVKPWKIGLRFAIKDIKPYFPFAFSYHINSVVGVLNGSLITILIGSLFGPTALGLISWGGGVGSLPRAGGEIMSRILFPLCSRMQNDKKRLALTIEKSLQYTNLVTFPVVALLIALASPITYIIFTSKWLGGIPSLYFFALQSVFVSIGVILNMALLALGGASKVRNINIISTIIIWVLLFPLMKLFDFNAYAIAVFLSSLTFLFTLNELKKVVSISLVKYTYSYLLASILMGLIIYCITLFMPVRSLFSLISTGLFGGIIYLFLLFLLEGRKLWADIVNIYTLFLGFTGFNMRFIKKVLK